MRVVTSDDDALGCLDDKFDEGIYVLPSAFLSRSGDATSVQATLL
jgi:hypothetical protein